MTAGRGRGRPKPKVEEPVILTLISDDEDDDKKVTADRLLRSLSDDLMKIIFFVPPQTESNSIIKPMSFEPKLEEINVVLEGKSLLKMNTFE